MDKLLNIMSHDMGITRFEGESDSTFAYRVCYSALGQWCLKVAQSRDNLNETKGATKNSQTIIINNLLQRFSKLYPSIYDYFVDPNDGKRSFAIHIRRVYEETGYLLTDDNNRNYLADFGRSVCVGSSYLHIGALDSMYAVNGLGIFSPVADNLSTTNEFLIRDDLTYERYLYEQYNIVDFYENNDTLDLQFFNPMSSKTPSRSWSSEMNTEYAVARVNEYGPYYRVIKEPDNSILFADERTEPHGNKLTSYEYRRLYYALKAHYGRPLRAWINKLDDEYSIISFEGHLPNREYYYLLLLSWPHENAFNKVKFYIKNDFLKNVSSTLQNLGIRLKGGHNG